MEKIPQAKEKVVFCGTSCRYVFSVVFQISTQSVQHAEQLQGMFILI